MIPTLLILLFVCILGVLHTYVFYPAYIVRRAAVRGCKGIIKPDSPAEWPTVHLLMAVHNEEAVLPAKLESLLRQDYRGKIHFRIASDDSRDRTDNLLRAFAANVPADSCQLTFNQHRRGKPNTVNRLAAGLPDGHVFVLTDASVILRPDTITELIRPLIHDPGVGLTDATIVHTGIRETGVSRLEDRYIRGEVEIKRAESKVYGRFAGPFGGCWAIRSEAFHPVPDNFLVDDYFLCMAAYEDGWRGVSCPDAVVTEGVGQTLGDEFRRKRRIGAGNWQNLVRFRDLWWPPYPSHWAFAFFSHKVLRWLSPHLLLTGGLSSLSLLLLTGNYWAVPAFVLLLALLCTCVPALRYFTAMNAALLAGFIDYVKGIRTNVWQPSQRASSRGTTRDPE